MTKLVPVILLACVLVSCDSGPADEYVPPEVHVPTGLAGTSFDLVGYRDHYGNDVVPGSDFSIYWGGSLEFPTDTAFALRIGGSGFEVELEGSMERSGKALLLDGRSGYPIFGIVGPDDQTSVRLFNLSMRAHLTPVREMSFGGGPADIRGAAWPGSVSADSVIAEPTAVGSGAASNFGWRDIPALLFNNSSYSTSLVGGEVRLQKGVFAARMDLSMCQHGSSACWPGVESVVGPYVRAGHTIVVDPDTEFPLFGYEHDGVIDFHDVFFGLYDLRIPVAD